MEDELKSPVDLKEFDKDEAVHIPHADVDDSDDDADFIRIPESRTSGALTSDLGSKPIEDRLGNNMSPDSLNGPISDGNPNNTLPDINNQPISSRRSSNLTPDLVKTPRTRSDTEIEYLMSEQEIDELDKRMKEVLDNLQRQKEDFETWENDLNARRLKAFGRLKALGRCHKRRLEMYDTLKGYVENTKGITPATKNANC